MNKVDFSELMSAPVARPKKTAKAPTDIERLHASQFAAAMVENRMKAITAYRKIFPDRLYRQDGKPKAATSLNNEAGQYAKKPWVREAIRDLTYQIYDDLSDPKTGVITLLNDAIHANVLDLFDDDTGEIKDITDLKKLPLPVQKVIGEIDIDETYKDGKLTKKRIRVRNLDKLRSIQLIAQLLKWLQDEDDSNDLNISDLIADSELADRESARLRQQHNEAIEGEYESF